MLALHVRNDFAREENRAEKVQVHRLPPILHASSEKTLGRRTASVGDTNINFTEFRADRSYIQVAEASGGQILLLDRTEIASPAIAHNYASGANHQLLITAY